MAGKQIEIATDGGRFEAYIAAPDSGKVPGVILVSSIFGLDQNMKDMCDDLAQRGWVALVQNFFWRDQDSGPLKMEDCQRAVARAQRIDFPKSMDDLMQGIAEVKRHRNCNGKVAVFGFCFGGPYAWRAAGLRLMRRCRFTAPSFLNILSPATIRVARFRSTMAIKTNSRRRRNSRR